MHARHKMHKKHKAEGGSITMKPGMEESGGTPSVLREAKERKKGGKVHMAGHKSKFRLDKPGRKKGGRVGADSSPLTTAYKMAGGAKTDEHGPLEAPK